MSEFDWYQKLRGALLDVVDEFGRLADFAPDLNYTRLYSYEAPLSDESWCAFVEANPLSSDPRHRNCER